MTLMFVEVICNRRTASPVAKAWRTQAKEIKLFRLPPVCSMHSPISSILVIVMGRSVAFRT